MRDSRLYSICVVVLLILFGDSSADNGLRFERHPEGVDYDESYRIKVTRGQEVINSTLAQGGHYKAITVTVSAFNAHFVLDLHLNTYLFAVGYVERSFSKDGVVYHDVNHTEGHCYYLGKVRDQPQSMAAVSTCKGIVGYFTVGNASYHIDPASNELHGPHRVYRSRSDAKTVYRCGHEGADFGSLMNPAKYNKRLKRFIWPQDLDKKNKIVEVYVANDHSQFLTKGSDVNVIIQRTKNIVNIASAGYQPLGIYIVLVGVEVWNMEDKITVDPSSSNSTLYQWAAYRSNSINPSHYNDNGILITNKTFDAHGNLGVVGKAFTGQMCKNELSAAFVSDVNALPYAAGSTMDHEMGHNFGLQHDDEMAAPCTCSDPKGICVMSSKSESGSSSFTWSQCSLDQFAYSFQHGLDICLYNVPQTIEPNNVLCGNGIVDTGEQCDCGNSTVQECNKACCDHSTCQLISPATCAYGRCCNINTCQILSCGTSCRAKADANCDLEEFCDGINPLCLNDTHLPDGANCTVNGVAAYCYNGLCRSHQSQCELLWGPGTPVSSFDVCYKLNQRGQFYGSCGINWLPSVTFVPCPDSDLLCGTLQCQDFSRSLSYYLEYYIRGGNITYGGDTCHSAVFDFGRDTQDPGYVPSGASCGTGKMCVNQQCKNVSSLNTIPCASSCQSNEVCNNFGQCQSTNGICPQSTATATPTATQTSATNTSPVSATTTAKPSMPTQTVSTSTATESTPSSTASTPTPSTSTPTPGTSTPTPSTSTTISSTNAPIPSESTPTPGTSIPTPSTGTPNATTMQTAVVVLGVVLGALGLAMIALLLYFCLRNRSPGTFFPSGEPTTAGPPGESVFTRGASTPAQTELRRIPEERYYLPRQNIYTGMPVAPQTQNLQPDWGLVVRTGQPLGSGFQNPNAFYAYSSRDNIMKMPQIVIR